MIYANLSLAEVYPKLDFFLARDKRPVRSRASTPCKHILAEKLATFANDTKEIENRAHLWVELDGEPRFRAVDDTLIGPVVGINEEGKPIGWQCAGINSIPPILLTINLTHLLRLYRAFKRQSNCCSPKKMNKINLL